MKLVDIAKCHEDSPDFTSSLSLLEEATNHLEKRLKNIVTLCQERQKVNAKDRDLTQKLIREFEIIGSTNLHIPEKDVSTASNCVEVITTALKQVVDMQERMFEQLNLGIVLPLQHFLNHDLEQVKATRREFTKAHADTLQLTEKMAQCKKNELSSLVETSLPLQVFDSRIAFHKMTCQYSLQLNSLHAKGTPDFLSRMVDFMMFNLSYFRLGMITTEDSEPHATALYTLIEKLRKEVQSHETSEHARSMTLMREVGQTRLQSLVHFYNKDLQMPVDSAKTTIQQHMNSSKASGHLLEDYSLDLPSRTATPPSTKAGYLWYAEPRTFGTHWIRLYFSIKNGMLLSESTKVKIPISLSLNLCNAKPADVHDTERNFAFKVTSPVRVLLLQCESSLDLQDWLETINNAISCAITSAPSGHASLASSSSSSAATGSKDRNKDRNNGTLPAKNGSDGKLMPVKPPRRKSHSVKDLFVLPGNEICADCGASRPRWASVNLGVLICIECSGAHRSLGVYVSQVRSLTLDSLKPSSVRQLRSIGNTKANVVYEALLPADFDKSSLRKPDGGRTDFIIEKYVSMKYAKPEDKERKLVERQAARAESLRKSNQVLGVSATVSPPLGGSSQLSASGSNLAGEKKNQTDGMKKSASCDLSQPKEKEEGGNGKTSQEGDEEYREVTSESTGNDEDGQTSSGKSPDDRQQPEVGAGDTEEQLVNSSAEQPKETDNHVQNSNETQ